MFLFSKLDEQHKRQFAREVSTLIGHDVDPLHIGQDTERKLFGQRTALQELPTTELYEVLATTAGLRKTTAIEQ